MNEEQVQWALKALQGNIRMEMMTILAECVKNVPQEELIENPAKMIYTVDSNGEVNYIFDNDFDETLSEEQVAEMEIALQGNAKEEAMTIINHFDENVDANLRTGNPIHLVYLASTNGFCTGYCTDEIENMSDNQKEQLKKMLFRLGAIDRLA
jgi:hypothetical protein